MVNLLLTFLAAGAASYLFYRLKVPGGVMVGSMLGVCAFGSITGRAFMPPVAKLAAQIAAGAFIACTVEKSDLKRMKEIYKPASLLIGSMLLLNLVMGVVIYALSDLDLMTSFFCAVPGAMGDTTIIATEMGANGGIVAVVQFVRMLAGVGLFPMYIMRATAGESQTDENQPERVITSVKSSANMARTAVVAIVFGVAGNMLGVPAGALVFSMVAVIIFKLITDRAYLHPALKRAAQLLSGAYVGSSMTWQDIMTLRTLVLPVLLLLVAYAINCAVTGGLMKKLFGLSRRQGMLALTPAGASDMALISADMGVDSPDLIILQVLRLVAVVTIFPQVIRLAVLLIGN